MVWFFSRTNDKIERPKDGLNSSRDLEAAVPLNAEETRKQEMAIQADAVAVVEGKKDMKDKDAYHFLYLY